VFQELKCNSPPITEVTLPEIVTVAALRELLQKRNEMN
jgi:hypothetical protein